MSLLKSIFNVDLFWGDQLIPNIKTVLNSSDSEVPTSKAVKDYVDNSNIQFQTALAALNNKVSTLDSEITTLTNSSADLSTKVVSLQNLCSTFVTEINAIQTEDVYLQNQITALSTSVNSSISSLQATDTSLQSAINSITVTNSNFTSQLQTLANRDAALEAQVTALNSQILLMESKWTATNLFSSTVPSTNQISTTQSLTSKIKSGFGLRFKMYGDTGYRYAVVTVITDTLISIAGSPLSTTLALTTLEYCDARNVERFSFDLSSRTFNVTNDTNAFIDLTNNGNYLPFKWISSKARLVQVKANIYNKGTSTNPAFNIQLGALTSSVFSSPLALTASATWFDTGVTIDKDNNYIDFDELVSLIITTASSDAKQPTLEFIFVLE